jgi:membrane-bound lytic murein transglycosylase D
MPRVNANRFNCCQPAALPLAVLAFAYTAFVAPRARAQTIPDAWIEQALEAGDQLFDAFAPEDVKEEYRMPTREEWDAFWWSVESALTSGTPEELARLDPYAEQALNWLDAIPALQPTADWLRQRTDYFAAAAAAPELSPRAPPPPRTRDWPRPPRASHPSPPSTHAMPPSTRSVEFWKQRVRSRSAPAPAAETVDIPRLKAIFQDEGVPPELVWIAEAESGLNPRARSPVGALGLFQFMPATATQYGLSLDPVDERLDGERSARAAARYLRYLHGLFGDWPLALAAYNAGEGRVRRAMRRAGGDSFEGIAGALPSETQMYVPKVLATIAVREGREFDASG